MYVKCLAWYQACSSANKHRLLCSGGVGDNGNNIPSG